MDETNGKIINMDIPATTRLHFDIGRDQGRYALGVRLPPDKI